MERLLNADTMGTIIPVDELERRRAVRTLVASTEWKDIVASFAISGITLSETDAANVVCMMTGVATDQQRMVEMSCAVRPDS